jgi:hypothetical protein
MTEEDYLKMIKDYEEIKWSLKGEDRDDLEHLIKVRDIWKGNLPEEIDSREKYEKMIEGKLEGSVWKIFQEEEK